MRYQDKNEVARPSFQASALQVFNLRLDLKAAHPGKLPLVGTQPPVLRVIFVYWQILI